MSGAEAAVATGGLLGFPGCLEAGQVSAVAQEALSELPGMLTLSPLLENKQPGKQTSAQSVHTSSTCTLKSAFQS